MFGPNDKIKLSNTLEFILNLHTERGSCEAEPIPSNYPCEAFIFELDFVIKFPPHVSDEYPLHGQLEYVSESSETVFEATWPPPNIFEQEIKSGVAPYINEVENLLYKHFQQEGFEDYQRCKYFLIVPLAPLNQGTNNYGRWMTPREEINFKWQTGRCPFYDEKWIPLRYGGIGIEGQLLCSKN